MFVFLFRVCVLPYFCTAFFETCCPALPVCALVTLSARASTCLSSSPLARTVAAVDTPPSPEHQVEQLDTHRSTPSVQ